MPKLKNSNATFLKNFKQCAYQIFADVLGQLFFQRLGIYELPILAFFIASDKGNAGRLLPGIFHLFVNLSPSFVIQKLCLKRPGFFPSYHVDTSLPSAVCVTSTPCRHCKNSLETSSLCPPKGQLQSQ